MRVYAIILGMAAALCGCSLQSEPTTTRDVYLVDVSDSLTQEIDHVFEEGGSGHPDFTWEGHITRYGVIRNASYADVVECKLEPANKYFSNEGQRKQEIQEYAKLLRTLAHGDTTEYAGSLIFESLMNELVYLSQDEDIETTVYLFSDLLEFNERISFYMPKYRRMLKEHPEQVREIMRSKIKSLEHASHINLIIVYEPSVDTETNEFFTLVVEEVYKPLLGELGIRVSVITNV